MSDSKAGKPTVIDLFAGVGGLSLGACRAGFDLRLAVEKDTHAAAAHACNFPNACHSKADISLMQGSDLLKAAGLEQGELTGLIGGPPCQGFSTMGHRQVGDSRNHLFKKFFSLVQQTRPKFFLAENVPGIMNECYGAIRDDAFSELSGYTMLPPFRVCAADYGAATSRTRVLFFGYLADEANRLTIADFAPAKETASVTVGDALLGLPTTLRESWDTDDMGWHKVRRDLPGAFGLRAHGLVPDKVGHSNTISIWKTKRLTSGCIYTHHEPDTVRRFAELAEGEIDRVSRGLRLSRTGLCPTLRAGTDSSRGSYQAVRPIHPTEPRVITPREAARLQGFPDWFRFDPTKWHSFRQIGNSVSPILAEHILKSVRRKFSTYSSSADSTQRAA